MTGIPVTRPSGELSEAAVPLTGGINWIKIETGDDDHSHLITPEKHLAYNLVQH